nr:hypothetical protein [Klebsiella pneumoniae]
MKTAIWVVVYFTMCFLLFTGWIFAFAQYAPYNGQEHAFSLTEIYSNVLMSLADESGQMIRFHHVVPVLGIYSLSALLTFVGYIIYAKWFTHNRLKGNLLPK